MLSLNLRAVAPEGYCRTLFALCMVEVAETPSRLLKEPRAPKQRAFFIPKSLKMEIEQTPPATEPGKIFIEVEPLTAKGFEALCKLEETSKLMDKWLDEVWMGDRKMTFQFNEKYRSLYDWFREAVFHQAKNIFDISGGERI